MPARWLLCALLIAACAPIRPPARIALLAPFEGRYREIGYEALYAARLALQDTGPLKIELLPIDDGGTAASAADRARALSLDPQVQIALVLGLPATDALTLSAFGNIPVLVVGEWGIRPPGNHVFMQADSSGEGLYNISPRADILAMAAVQGQMVATEMLSLQEFAELQPDLGDASILSVAPLPNTSFIERYRASDPFAPVPRLYATATYDTMMFALDALQNESGRERVATHLTEHYPTNMPTYIYRFDTNGDLLPVDPVVK